jgi:hypothetical protein
LPGSGPGTRARSTWAARVWSGRSRLLEAARTTLRWLLAVAAKDSNFPCVGLASGARLQERRAPGADRVEPLPLEPSLVLGNFEELRLTASTPTKIVQGASTPSERATQTSTRRFDRASIRLVT